MARLLTITTPTAETVQGNAALSHYAFNGNTSEKIFTFQYGSTAIGLTSFGLSLTQNGTGGFNIFPIGSSSISMTPGQRMSFAVTYDSSLGNSSYSNLFCSIPIYTTDDSIIKLIGPTHSITFTNNIPIQSTKRELGPLLTTDSNRNYIISQAGLKITNDLTSFGLARTNPKLTGNVKITVDSKDNIWLNSIEAEKSLAANKFKKVKIFSDSSYAVDIYNFFDNGNTPAEVVFSLYEDDPLYTSTKRTLDKQFDRFYQYGVTETDSMYYTENFSMFAPLYLKQEVPDYFVIFRTNGPVNSFSYDLSDPDQGVLNEILANSTIVRTVDMGPKTSIGKYFIIKSLQSLSSKKK